MKKLQMISNLWMFAKLELKRKRRKDKKKTKFPKPIR